MSGAALVERDECKHVREIHKEGEPGLSRPFTQPVVG